ncbi:tRNA pseudouridine synthase B [Candidatus Desulfarcum epimagneticum]|uniref:tRNA pseudouridine synthase B n=1 Tax=uncultured Desulfobacteraceae bacterium TaxID=218296 RepID=A0A484HIR0_9BACT|nr:tRNA pseudouridine synthase B [uncultured Desulfobacteraceae bacterium]
MALDKPENFSSAKALAAVKRLLGVSKAGHAGTLDPMATGVLVCCLNRATRLSRFFMHGPKTYEAELCLGAETDTQDRMGEVVSTGEVPDISREGIASVFQRFEGWMNQLPPVYSALKHKGVPLYRLARKGSPVQKPPRRVHIRSIDILTVDMPVVSFRVSCSAGTYIRTLCADVGKALGCGGHLKELRRTRSGGFSLDEAATLPELEALAASGEAGNRVIGMADALRDMPCRRAGRGLVKKIRNGVSLSDADFPGDSAPPAAGFLKIVDGENNLVAVTEKISASASHAYCCVF